MSPPQPYSPRGTRVPATSVKIPLELKAAVQAKAEKRGETLTDVIVRALTAYAEEPDQPES